MRTSACLHRDRKRAPEWGQNGLKNGPKIARETAENERAHFVRRFTVLTCQYVQATLQKHLIHTSHTHIIMGHARSWTCRRPQGVGVGPLRTDADREGGGQKRPVFADILYGQPRRRQQPGRTKVGGACLCYVWVTSIQAIRYWRNLRNGYAYYTCCSNEYINLVSCVRSPIKH